MIYSRPTNFSYPILTNTQTDYKENIFTFDIDVKDNLYNYIFDITYDVKSSFLNEQLSNGSAELILVISSTDNLLYNIDYSNPIVEIKKSRLNLNKNTKVQLFIRSVTEINFYNNNDLNDFYNQYKDSIIVPKYMLLAISELILFSGESVNSYEFFKTSVNENLDCEFKIEIDSEFINLIFKDESFRFLDLPYHRNLNNLYIRLGLERALIYFINNYIEANNTIEDGVILENIETNSNLDFKLHSLLISKGISELSLDNIDEVISLISDNLIQKNCSAIRRLTIES